MPVNSRQIVLARRPEGAPQVDDFAMRSAALDAPGADEVLVRQSSGSRSIPTCAWP